MSSFMSQMQGSAEQPALMPPPGIQPNFDDPESRAFAVHVVDGIFTAILIVFVSLRLYAKAFIFQAFGWDDAVCLFGSMVSITFSALVAHVFNAGFGRHQWDVPMSVFHNETLVKELKAISFLFDPMMILAKVSILLLFFRIFATTRLFRTWIYIGIITTTINHGTGLILAVTLCSPTNVSYTECAHRTRTKSVVISGFNILNDFFILLLPIFIIRGLQMKYKRKIGLYAIFGTGFGACLISIIGMIYRVIDWYNHDITWHLGPLVCFSIIEVNITLIAGCMPLIPMIFRHHHIFSSSGGGKPKFVLRDVVRDKNVVPSKELIGMTATEVPAPRVGSGDFHFGLEKTVAGSGNERDEERHEEGDGGDMGDRGNWWLYGSVR